MCWSTTVRSLPCYVDIDARVLTCEDPAAMQEMCLDITEIDLDVTEKTFQTNVISMFAMSKYALKHMKRGDTIVNSTSVAAYMSNPTLLDYASTKGAIATFTRGLAQQQAKNGIRVNAVAPGIM
jgi:NAD(P)-dependent dehydrogenase (short-subunit alcohol dehydrogenase family)